MSKRRRPKRRTRIVLLDGEVFHVVWRRRDIVSVQRLTRRERDMALRMLDDVHAEVDAILRGNN